MSESLEVLQARVCDLRVVELQFSELAQLFDMFEVVIADVGDAEVQHSELAEVVQVSEVSRSLFANGHVKVADACMNDIRKEVIAQQLPQPNWSRWCSVISVGL